VSKQNASPVQEGEREKWENDMDLLPYRNI
jgi:hypothetical protein